MKKAFLPIFDLLPSSLRKGFKALACLMALIFINFGASAQIINENFETAP